MEPIAEDVPLEEKIIHQRWELPHVGFYWLIAEVDPEKELAFGYANLNDDVMAEWGYISLKELKENGAFPLDDWEPRKFKDVEREY